MVLPKSGGLAGNHTLWPHWRLLGIVMCSTELLAAYCLPHHTRFVHLFNVQLCWRLHLSVFIQLHACLLLTHEWKHPGRRKCQCKHEETKEEIRNSQNGTRSCNFLWITCSENYSNKHDKLNDLNKVPSLFNMEYNNFFLPKIKLDVNASLFSIVLSFQLKITEGVYNRLLSLITSLRSMLFKFLWEIL